MTENIQHPTSLVDAPEIVDPDPAQAEDYEVGLKSLNQWQLAWRKFRKHKLALIGLAVLALMLVGAIIGPILMPFSFTDIPQPDEIVQAGRPPSLAHPMGETGGLQRDVFLLVVNGARTSLMIGFSAMAIGVFIGTIVGAIAGFAGGIVDNGLMRLVDVMLSLPTLFVILVASKFLGNGTVTVVIVIFGLFSWMGVSRLVRSLFLSIREREFVEAAQAVGVTDRRIIFRHILPNAFSPIVVAASLIVASRHHLRGVRELPRVRGRPDLADLGQHPLRRPPVPRPRQLVVAVLPGPRDHHHGARGELRRRRTAGRLRPEVAGMTETSTVRPGLGAPPPDDILLDVRHMKTYFKVMDGVVPAVDDISFSLARGSTLGIVGESGSGKSVTALTIMRLLDIPPAEIGLESEVWFDGREILSLPESEMRKIRGNDMAMIFQEPLTSLNPVFTVGDQIAEQVELHMNVNARESRDRAIEMLRLVGIPSPERRAKQYPHELSGGMRQRVMIGMALSCDPKLLIADEPSTALDVTVQAQILELLRAIQERTGAALILITHDLGVVAEMVDDVIVMYAGQIVEQGTVEQVLIEPRMPYTMGLIESIPGVEKRGGRLSAISGVVPSPFHLPPNCRFEPRCPYGWDLCRSVPPGALRRRRVGAPLALPPAPRWVCRAS